MKTGLVFLVSVCLYAVAANTLRTNKTHREVVVNQLCQYSGANTLKEITSQLKKEFETLKKELTQQLITMNKTENRGIVFAIQRLGGREAMNTNSLIIELIKFYNSMLSEILKLPKRNCRQAVDRSFFLNEAMNKNKLIIRLLKSC